MKEFIGYEKIIQGFFRRVDKGTLSHAHLIIGPNGIGKSILARIFALKILNKDKDIDYVDIINYRPSKASMGVDEVREIIEEVSKRPYEGDKKVIIIHEGSKLTVQAQNALLKTIEEPPQGVYIILLAESLETLLDTIKSRCQVYKLTPLNNRQMEMYINTLGRYSEEEIRASLAYGEGIPGKAERLLNDSNLSELREVIMSLLKDINYAKEDLVLIYENKLENYKTEKDEVLNLMASFIRDIIVAKELEDKNKIINIDKYNDIVEVANSLSYKKLNSMLEYIKEGRVNLMNNGNYSLVISVILMGFLEV
ncbi:MAG: DNA polymerase III subunit delta' [Clostridium sp.]|nr:DNA polymerase III subunit delta' [Clostridium sp.]MCI7444249.1 DNA polymerase III subunit delta' [Clostridium sp.]